MPRKEAPPVYANLRLGGPPATKKTDRSTANSGRTSDKASERAPSGFDANKGLGEEGLPSARLSGIIDSPVFKDVSDEDVDDDEFPEFHERQDALMLGLDDSFDDEDDSDDDHFVLSNHEIKDPENFFAENSFIADM
jgi:hypothetical protein